MKASVERLRWGLAAAVVLLLVLVGGSIGYGHYRQLKKWRDALRHLNLHGPHETTGFTYSSSPKDRTSYKVRAARVVEHGDGTWSMYDVAVTLYSKTSSDEDHIYGSDIEYDQNTGVARAVGAVHMDLEIGGSLKNGKPAAATAQQSGGESTDVIHVQTSGLVYLHKLGVAATDQPTEFRYQGMQCTSTGAEFDSNSSQLHLLADVVMHGTLQNAPFVVHATKADLDRDQNVIVVTHAVGESKGRVLRAETVTAHTRKDGSLLSAEAGGGVSLDAGTQHLTAAAYSGTFNVESLPQAGKLTGGVTATDSAPQRPAQGQADEVDAAFTPEGVLSQLTALGHASVRAIERKPNVPDLTRTMQGERMVATMASVRPAGGKRASTSELQALHVIGAASASGTSLGAGGALKTTRVNADDLRALFAPGGARKPQIKQLSGEGHTRLEQSSTAGDKQTSAADTLQATFSNEQTDKGDGLQIATADQQGHVVIHSVPAAKPGSHVAEPSDATAARASYVQATDTLTLTGAAHFTQGQTTLDAASIAVNQQTQDVLAVGSVLATLTGAPRSPTAARTQTPQAEPQVTHVSAARATLTHSSQVAEFFGAANQPARLWQGASQVQAATLLFDQQKKTLAARPAPGAQVHAVFGDSTQHARPANKPPAAPEVVRVAANTMDYDDLHRQADFDGNVLLQSPTAQAQAQHGVALLNESPTGGAQPAGAAVLGGSLKRVVLTQNVRIEQDERTGTGTQLVYTAADSLYVLTGTAAKPPHIVDPQQGSVTGASLSFHGPDSTIVVVGSTSPDKPGRVRTEVEVRGK